ncbi:T6SS phospholipase effector Tle1-like catalytic domain-containing protein [Pseudoalteromonas sp. GB43]
MSQAMPMAVNLVNTLVINTGAGATTKHIIVKVLGDVDVEIQLFSQGNKAVVEKQAAQHYRFNNLSQDTPYTLKAIVAGKAEFTLVNEQQFADYFNSNTVKSFNIGSKGGPQLLQHKILPKGHVELTLLAEPPCFGVFFDGTGNNRFNDIQDSTDSKEPTNVVKLFELYPIKTFQNRHYEEGIGTEANKSDSTLDMGLAFSFDERIKQALIRTAEFFKKFAYTKTGFIDVFGFSRGAAQARAFVNQVNAIYQDKPNYWGGIKPVIRFVGLFDSVASIGGDGDNNHSEFYADDELDYPINLNLASSSAGYVMHLAAFDEKRDKFPLSSLLSSNKLLSENHKEIELPGVHSDIGGGYGPVETNILYPRQYIAKPSW